MGVKGLIVSGKFSEILAREKAGEDIEIGELLVAEKDGKKILLQAYDLEYGSQISQQNLELVSGMKLEEETDTSFLDARLRNYNLARLKTLISLSGRSANSSKSLPSFFSPIRSVTEKDLSFVTKPKKPMFIGNLRSGSKVLDIDLFLPGEKVLSHHILIPATTGRGKSNLASVMLWNLVPQDYCGILVLDPHDEYYGRTYLGLKDHPKKENVVYYTPNNPPPGARSLSISVSDIRPNHFNGAVQWSVPQKEALSAYYSAYGKDWIKAIVSQRELSVSFNEATLGVVRRRLVSLLGISFSNNEFREKSIFSFHKGKTTTSDICDELEKGKVVIIDTSGFSGSIEILIGSIMTEAIYKRYKNYKNKGTLNHMPVVSVFLEEAPRVLGKEVLERGPNIFSTIAREGRKFKVGLTAITQLPSLIPRQILANMNTKIILGIEMSPERQAIIDSASQDLSSDSRAIASLDKGESIITSNFTRFAMPVKIPLFSEYVKKEEAQLKKLSKNSFSGVSFS